MELKDISQEQYDTRLAALKEQAQVLHDTFRRILDESYNRRYHESTVLEMQHYIIKNIMSLGLYLNKRNAHLVTFLVYTFNNSIYIPEDSQVDQADCYFHTTSIEFARQAIAYYILRKPEKVLCLSRFLNIPHFLNR